MAVTLRNGKAYEGPELSTILEEKDKEEAEV